MARMTRMTMHGRGGFADTVQRAGAESDLLKQQEYMQVEWEAWQSVCARLSDLNIDINEQDKLANAIRLWGEELHQLRLGDPSHDENALREAREKAR